MHSKIIESMKDKGIFDQFRKDCIADVDTKPGYINLHQSVNKSVATYLKHITWSSKLVRFNVRDGMRKHIVGSSYFEKGVDRIVNQAVDPKINTDFFPIVENFVYEHLGIQKPKAGETAVVEEDDKTCMNEEMDIDVSEDEDLKPDEALLLETIKLPEFPQEGTADYVKGEEEEEEVEEEDIKMNTNPEVANIEMPHENENIASSNSFPENTKYEYTNLNDPSTSYSPLPPPPPPREDYSRKYDDDDYPDEKDLVIDEDEVREEEMPAEDDDTDEESPPFEAIGLTSPPHSFPSALLNLSPPKPTRNDTEDETDSPSLKEHAVDKEQPSSNDSSSQSDNNNTLTTKPTSSSHSSSHRNRGSSSSSSHRKSSSSDKHRHSSSSHSSKDKSSSSTSRSHSSSKHDDHSSSRSKEDERRKGGKESTSSKSGERDSSKKESKSSSSSRHSRHSSSHSSSRKHSSTSTSEKRYNDDNDRKHSDSSSSRRSSRVSESSSKHHTTSHSSSLKSSSSKEPKEPSSSSHHHRDRSSTRSHSNSKRDDPKHHKHSSSSSSSRSKTSETNNSSNREREHKSSSSSSTLRHKSFSDERNQSDAVKDSQETEDQQQQQEEEEAKKVQYRIDDDKNQESTLVPTTENESFASNDSPPSPPPPSQTIEQSYAVKNFCSDNTVDLSSQQSVPADLLMMSTTTSHVRTETVDLTEDDSLMDTDNALIIATPDDSAESNSNSIDEEVQSVTTIPTTTVPTFTGSTVAPDVVHARTVNPNAVRYLDTVIPFQTRAILCQYLDPLFDERSVPMSAPESVRTESRKVSVVLNNCKLNDNMMDWLQSNGAIVTYDRRDFRNCF